MTQIKIFTETTYSNPADKKAMTTGGLEKKVNDFLTDLDQQLVAILAGGDDFVKEN